MRDFFKPVAVCILLILSVSCSNGRTGQAKVPIPLPKPGLIHEKIVCSSDPEKSYALFLPESSANQLFPVIIAFDPQGDGALPLKMYKDIAQEYGFILMGSNDSKNGLPGDEVKKIVGALMDEVHAAYPVDTNRIFLLGFSGGARVAAMTGLYLMPVKGVIGCGAGIGGGEQPVAFKFDYFGIVGTADFNMNEMLQSDEPLSKAGFRHFIATFAGKHEWPHVEVMEDAFRWITLNAMKDGVLKKDDALISAIVAGFRNRITNYEKSNQLITAAESCREAISFVEGLASADEFIKRLIEIEKRADYQSQIACRLTALKKEEEEKEELMQALQGKDIAWWTKKISNIELKNGTLTPDDTLKNRRLISFLSLFCYMNVNAAIARRDENAAIKIIAIYEMADKPNPEPNYMRAVILARRSENEAAFAQLKIAVTKGFADKGRLASQPEFTAMTNSPAWDDLFKK